MIEVPIMRWEHDTVQLPQSALFAVLLPDAGFPLRHALRMLPRYDPSPDAWKKDPPMTNCRFPSHLQH